jgi:D-3-phosphoglycerate dehydrogenase
VIVKNALPLPSIKHTTHPLYASLYPMKKVLITDDVHPLMLEGFQKQGYMVDYQPNTNHQKVLSIIGDYEGLIVNSKIFVHQELIDRAVKLKFVGRLGSGMEIIDRKYAAQKGIAVHNSPEGNRNAVAEHAIGMLLALANQFVAADNQVRQKIWQREARRGFEIEGLTVGIIGFGHTGARFARKLAGFDMKILAYDKYLPTGYSLPYQLNNVVETDVQTIQNQADIISFHLPLTVETHHFLNDDFLNRCSKKIILINTSRGKVADLKTVVHGLATGKLRGACLDVFENEKVETFSSEETLLYERLYGFKNTVLTPHVAGWTHESKRNLAQILLDKIANI